MIKRCLSLFLCFIFFVLGPKGYAQKVSNVIYRQDQSNIIISYDLEVKRPTKVILYVSTDAGNNWQGPLLKVVGGIGNNISSGSHKIVWNVLEEFNELRGDKIVFKVKLDSGNIETILIGNQEWITKNLNVSEYRNGDVIPEVQDPEDWAKLTTGAWCYYNNDSENGKIYGKLYNSYAVNDPRGLAPEGYHIASSNEWNILIDYLGGNISSAGGKMKEKDLHYWNSPNEDASNSSSFSGQPGGTRNIDGSYKNKGDFGFWWSNLFNTTKANSFSLNSNNGFIVEILNDFRLGFSVRCIKD